MDINQLSVATIRSLGIDMINKANSGHPGMVLGSAPALYTLFTKEMNINPENTEWFNRDRFVLASGHACALLYSLLHLSGFEISLDDLKQFRQWGSITPGHPEYHVTPGIDASSGPLGQGIPTATGMAIAERALATRYNKPGFDIVNHYTYVLCGDGDLQEGVTYEGCSLAGKYKLGKLIVIYDSNKVTLDGPIELSFNEDVKKRFESCHWQVLEVEDGNDIEAIAKAIEEAKADTEHPSIIINHTIIGYGSKKQGTSATHGSPLGKEDGKYAKLSYGFDHEDFYVPEEVYQHFNDTVVARGKKANSEYNDMLIRYYRKYPNLFKSFMHDVLEDMVLDYDSFMPKFEVGHSEATRSISNKCINAIAAQYPSLYAGAADLSASTKSNISGAEAFTADNYSGRNFYYGIREFAMTAMMNGMTLHGGMRVISGAFCVFSDYLKAGLRMSCLMSLPIVLALTHDSVAVGEDGPTHQPIEQLATLRSMLNLRVLRPCDANETVAAYQVAMETRDRPSVLLLTRQNLVNQANSSFEGVSHGAYVISAEKERLDAILMSSGSEVDLCIQAQSKLLEEGIDVRVVSMPSFDLFDLQSDEYKESVLPKSCRARLSVEMATSYGWGKYVGLDGLSMSIDLYGASAPAAKVISEYGFTVEKVIENVHKLVK